MTPQGYPLFVVNDSGEIGAIIGWIPSLDDEVTYWPVVAWPDGQTMTCEPELAGARIFLDYAAAVRRVEEIERERAS